MADLHRIRENAAMRIHQTAREYRGSFLNKTSVIDSKISCLLINHLSAKCPSAFGSKKEAFQKEILTRFPEYWSKYESVFSEFDQVIRFRNCMAHSLVDVSEEALNRPSNQGIGFIDWENGSPITARLFNDWEVKANMIYCCLLEIERLIPRQTSAKS